MGFLQGDTRKEECNVKARTGQPFMAAQASIAWATSTFVPKNKAAFL